VQDKFDDDLLLASNFDWGSGLLIPWVLQHGLQTKTEKKYQWIRKSYATRRRTLGRPGAPQGQGDGCVENQGVALAFY